MAVHGSSTGEADAASPGTRAVRTASNTWRGRIDSHQAISHDSIANLGYDWSRVADPDIEPRYPFKVYLPRTTDDVVAAVRETAQLGQSLRVRSKGHSSNDLVLAEGGCVLLTQLMDRILDFDPEAGTITVQAGLANAVADDWLAERGWGLPVVGDHKDITVGGFASLGGISPTSHRTGLFIEHIVSLEFVDWTGEVHRCGPQEGADDFYALVAGLGRHGVITAATLEIVDIDKYGTVLTNDQAIYRDFDAFLTGSRTRLDALTDEYAARGMWLDLGKTAIGQFSAYRDMGQSAARSLRNTMSYGIHHRVGLAAGRLPGGVDKALKMASTAGVIFSPRYATVKNVEFFTDKLLDATVGDPTRMLIVLCPMDQYEDLIREAWEMLLRFRHRHGCFTFLSVYVKGLNSDYLARDGQRRFAEVTLLLGIRPAAFPDHMLNAVVEELDTIVLRHDAYRYMHTRTVADHERRARIDPNLRHLERRAAARDR